MKRDATADGRRIRSPGLAARLRFFAMIRAVAHSALVAMIAAACGRGDAAPRVPQAYDPGVKPDEMPSLLNDDLPFRYPAELYTRRVQGNVTLRIFIDRDGRV